MVDQDTHGHFARFHPSALSQIIRNFYVANMSSNEVPVASPQLHEYLSINFGNLKIAPRPATSAKFSLAIQLQALHLRQHLQQRLQLDRERKFFPAAFGHHSPPGPVFPPGRLRRSRGDVHGRHHRGTQQRGDRRQRPRRHRVRAQRRSGGRSRCGGGSAALGGKVPIQPLRQHDLHRLPLPLDEGREC